MYSIIKLLKSLNSTEATFQLSLALIFGMFSGFLPFFSLINILIVLIVFSLNIPLGVYTIFTIMFTLMGSILDSTFATIGYDLLTNQNLNEFWTILYNFNPALWLNFNHTITLGSFTVALILAIPLYFISKPLFNKYRTSFALLSHKIKIFKWFTPDIDTTKKVKLFRLWGSGLFLSIILVIVLFFILLFDPIIKYSFEYILSKATNSTIIINEVESNIQDTKIKFKNISIIKDDKVNTIDNISIDLNTMHLLNKKIDIKLLKIKNINLIKKDVVKQKVENLPLKTTTNQESKSDLLDNIKIDLPNINDMLNKEDLKSVKEAKAIETRFKDINKKWKKISKKDPKELLKDLKYYQKEYKKDKAILVSDAKKIKSLPTADYKYLTSKYSINQNGALNIVSTYISEDISQYTKLFIKYYKMAKPYLPEAEEKEEIKRLKGTWVKFKEIDPYPNFVVQKVTANILSDKFKMFNININHHIYSDVNIDIIRYQTKLLDLLKKIDLKNDGIDIYLKTTIKQYKSLDNLKFKISSSLDGKIQKAFKAKINKEISKYKKELKVKLEDKVKSQLGNISNKEFEQYGKLLKDTKALKAKLKKELTKKANKEINKKKKKIEKQLMNKLKSFF